MKKEILSTLFYLSLIITVLLSNTNFAQRHKTDTYEFKDNVRINTKTNVAEVMYYNGKTVYKGTPEEIARQFLHENKIIFGLNSISDLKLLEVIESPGGKHIGFIQTYKDIPIYGSETVVSINAKNQISTVANGCLPVKDLKSVMASLDKENAISKAKLKIKVNEKTLTGEPKAELFIYPDSLYQMHLIWKVNFSASEPKGSWEILVDAITGDAFDYKDMRVYETGQGKVFRPDPITALYNTSLTDQNNADYTALQGAYVITSLPNLNPPSGGVYRLQGTYARSEDLEASYPNPTPVTSSTSTFYYNRSQPGFEETNAYYFIDAQRQYVGSLGYSPQWNGYNYIRFDAHGFVDDNSWYDPAQQYLIYGDGGIDDAEDQDVILHEYTHALHDALMAGTFQVGTNEHLLGEGIADYMAVSYRRTLSTFQQDKVFPWDGNGETWNGRSLNASYLYPGNWAWSNYMGGTLWASTMMDIQNYGDMGRDVTNKLLLKSVNYANNSTIPPDHVFYVLKADQDIYGETHLSSLGKGFYNRGFFNAGIYPAPVHQSNLLSGNITSNTTWTGIKWVNGYTYIKPGVTVTSYAFLFIGDRQKIVVENGATLIIQGPLVKYFRADIQVDPGGALLFSKKAGEEEFVESELPSEYQLLGNYPNPFNPTTTIKYSLPKESSVELKIYDMMGSEIRTFNLTAQPSGYDEITWDGKNENGNPVSSGIYIYRIKFNEVGSMQFIVKSAKLILTK